MQENKTNKNPESQIPHLPQKKKKNSTLLPLTHLPSSQLHPPASKHQFSFPFISQTFVATEQIFKPKNENKKEHKKTEE
jgi:hypothetical protein